MVDVQYRLLTEGLAIKHVRLIIGNSMGGMHVWLWGEKYLEYMDALVPMATDRHGVTQLDAAPDNAGIHPPGPGIRSRQLH
jgi:homoserine acetyltransferase